jgi:hypothetical protein
MVPGKPFLSFDKLLLFGAGPVLEMSVARMAGLVAAYFDRLERLRARVAVVELPGRAHASVSPAEAGQVMLREALRERECDSWTLVESRRRSSGHRGARARAAPEDAPRGLTRARCQDGLLELARRGARSARRALERSSLAGPA